MVHELIGIDNNRVDMTGAQAGDKNVTEVVLSSAQDLFFRRNMNANFGDLGASIKELLEKHQVRHGVCVLCVLCVRTVYIRKCVFMCVVHSRLYLYHQRFAPPTHMLTPHVLCFPSSGLFPCSLAPPRPPSPMSPVSFHTSHISPISHMSPMSPISPVSPLSPQLAHNDNKNLQSLEDMQKFVENYPEFKKQAANVSKHVRPSGHCKHQYPRPMVD